MAGAAQIAASHARVPVINAGDGIGEHPSQVAPFLFTFVSLDWIILIQNFYFI